MNQTERQQRRSIYLLPNLFTTGTIFGGFYAIIASTQGRFEAAAIAIFIAMVADALDGRIARMTNTQSDFGLQYDSLADLVAFGVAPALIMYFWALDDLRLVNETLGRVGWIASFAYAAGAALRLARFNVQTESLDKRFFKGLPSPSAAALLVGSMWVMHNFDFKSSDAAIPYISLAITYLGGVLMVSNITYYSFKDVDALKKIPFFVVPAFVFVAPFITLKPSVILYSIFMTYILSGPVLSLYRQVRKLRRRQRRAAD
ncbi:CDP-diacylglycerol--serine O-phosphatidyltransferase [gamma proteobacterium HTCC5015]|nr:CDP-diacylglycerol--serine O-phosphatidyltransferase [gamma proteobacterium HTCC5015]